MSEIRIIRAGPERIGDLAELWAAMHTHHAGLPDLPPVRPVQDSWRRRRAQYEAWLADGDATLLIADDGGVALGYAMVRVEDGPPTWAIGERVGEIESLSVAPQARGGGIGARLIAAARDVAREAGAERLAVGVAHANAGALRLYEREGFRRFYALLIDGGPGS